MVLRSDMLVVDAKAFTLNYLRYSVKVTVAAQESKMPDLQHVGELDTGFTDEVMKKFIVDLRKETVTRWSLNAEREELLEVF